MNNAKQLFSVLQPIPDANRTTNGGDRLVKHFEGRGIIVGGQLPRWEESIVMKCS
jgi:hypothetical protein